MSGKHLRFIQRALLWAGTVGGHAAQLASEALWRGLKMAWLIWPGMV